MKIVMINTLPFGSTGKIMFGIAERNNLSGNESFCFYGNWKNTKKKNYLGQRFGYKIDNYFSTLIRKLTGNINFGCVLSTYDLIKKIKKIKPDLIHIHNIHLGIINISMLFKFIRKHNIPVIWTLHDCWSFTGRCPHFALNNCDKWKKGCGNCPYPPKDYPQANMDKTKYNWRLKRKLFNDINLTLVSPSQWLADLVNQSFLKTHPIKVINNGIDLKIFKPYESDFKEKNNIEGKFIILGVAFDWSFKKGLDVFIELSKRLDSNLYQIILVGTNDYIDKDLPQNIISIHRTQNQIELAKIYSSSDLLLNPTREDNYPTVNMEAIACGTPVLSFRTGGSPEIIKQETGCIVECGDIDRLEKEIIRIKNERPFRKNDCVISSQSFNMLEKFKEYIDLYKIIQ